jgi:Putative zincin peptidase
MRIKFDGRIDNLEDQASTPAAVSEFQRAAEIATRVGAYGMPVLLGLWYALSEIEWLGLGRLSNLTPLQTLVYGGLFAFTAVLVSTVGHELCHLLAMPHRLFEKNTLLGVWRATPMWKSTLYVSVGGRLTRAQFVWISVFPFLVLTIIPFLLLVFSNSPPSLFWGGVAALNGYGSAIDLFQAFRFAKSGHWTDVLREA